MHVGRKDTLRKLQKQAGAQPWRGVNYPTDNGVNLYKRQKTLHHFEQKLCLRGGTIGGRS
jgi:hypothetical protein